MRLFLLCRGAAMLSNSEQVLEAAVAGIPEIARMIAFLPHESRESAFGAAERIYLQTAKDLGGAEDLALNWTMAAMFHLREEVEEQLLTNRTLLKALLEELVEKPVEAATSKSEFRLPDNSSPKTIERDIGLLVHKTYGHGSQEDTLSNVAT